MRRQLVSALLMTIVLIVLLGVIYPLVVTGVAQVAFSDRANGSVVSRNGTAVGSSLIGQAFVDKGGNPLPRYFQPRPSNAGTPVTGSAPGAPGYDTTSSGGSNLGPSNTVLLNNVAARVKAYRTFNGLDASTPVPVDAVTSSASGLDPDISEQNALDQVARVAQARNLNPAAVRALVVQHVDARPWGFLGENTVNVLDLNLALDGRQ
ncbi:MAG: K(+)-transporting ATPase subunit C [Acidimicrobiales bacterium]